MASQQETRTRGFALGVIHRTGLDTPLRGYSTSVSAGGYSTTECPTWV
jgi:hypothetical protein